MSYKKYNPDKFKKEKGNTQQSATRKCLMCEKTFTSTWIGNRLCPKCTSVVKYRDAGSMVE